jgi:hypothetical protein
MQSQWKYVLLNKTHQKRTFELKPTQVPSVRSNVLKLTISHADKLNINIITRLFRVYGVSIYYAGAKSTGGKESKGQNVHSAQHYISAHALSS